VLRYEPERLVLGDLLEERAATHEHSTFLKVRDGELTYGEVGRMANRMARGFAATGVRAGDHVAVMLPNSVDFVCTTFALARLGAVLVPINTAYKGELLQHVLDTSDTSLLVVDESLLEHVAAVEARLPNLCAVVARSEGARGTRARLAKPVVPLARLREAGKETPRAAVRHFDLQAIMYTSGTTGPSKGVMVPHAHALTCALDSLCFLAHRPEETIYCPLPLFHAAALWDGLMAALLAGSSIAVVERFSVSRFWDDVRRFEAGLAMGVFSMIPLLMKQPETSRDRDHPLRSFYMGKSALDGEFERRFGVRSVETYTSTEVGIGTASPYGEWRVGSCGRANDVRFEVAIVDGSDRAVGPGEPGELVVRPRQPWVMTTGYYNAPQATMKAMRNLWFHTGDRARRDEDGYYYFLERIKDSIRCRGENISAFEVEREVNRHPGILESAAFAVPSELEEDELKLAVVAQPGARLDPADVAAFCAERLPAFMVPRYVELIDELPRTPTGKIAKHELRARGHRGLTAATWDRAEAKAASQGS